MVATINLSKRLHIFPIGLLCIILMLFLRDYVGLAIPSFVFLLLTTLIVLFGDKSDIINICVCLIPMLNAFQTKYALIIAMIAYFIRFGEKKQKFKANMIIFPLMVLVVWEIIHGLAGEFAPIEIIRLFVELLFCLFVVSIPYRTINYNYMARSLAFTTICICFIILLVQLKQTHYQINLLFSGIYRFGYGVNMDRLSVGFNPNILSFICLTSIECLCFVYYKKESKVTDTIMIVFLIVFGLLTMSKKFIVCGAIFTIMFLFEQKTLGKKLKYILSLSILSLIALFILSKVFPSVVDMIISRFNVDDISSGRIDITSFYNNQIASSPDLAWFGVGYYKYAEKLNTMFPGSSIPHNGIQELIVMWGIPGFLFFCWFIKEIVASGIRVNKGIKYANYIPILMILFFCMAAQMVSSTVIVMLIAVSYICLCENTNNEHKEQRRDLNEFIFKNTNRFKID